MLTAFGDRQRDLLTLLLNNKKGLTIDQMAAALNITRNAVREHVSALERDRLVAPRAFTVTGGRPGRVYALADRGFELFPKHYDLMARMLLESLIARLGGSGADEELRKLGVRMADQLKPRVPAGALPARAGAVADLMAELGYEATLAEGESAPTIEAQNCVYHELAKSDRTVCSLDLALIAELADAAVEHKTCMARGDDSCRFCLRAR
jgi:predicted ArsR family transcriptional regulator